MHSFLKLLLCLVMLAAPGMAATVSISVSSNGGPKFTTSGGAILVDGAIIRIGVFDLSNGHQATIQTSNDFNVVNSYFTALGEGIANAGTITQSGNSGNQLIINSLFGSGNVLGQISNVEATYLPTGTQLYAWVFNNSSTSSATEWGIFSASTGWNFPAGLGSETLSSFEIDTVLRGLGTGGTTTADQWQLAVVPEPGSALLLVAGAALTQRRRRVPVL